MGDEDPVFASPLGGHLDPSALRRRFGEATRRAELRTLPFHSLRHFFGSMAVNKASLVQVQAWMGHAHIQTTARYLHHRAQHNDAELLAAAFRASATAPQIRQESLEARTAGADQEPLAATATRLASTGSVAGHAAGLKPANVVQREARDYGVAAA